MAGNLLNTYITGFDRAIRETVETKGGKMRPLHSARYRRSVP